MKKVEKGVAAAAAALDQLSQFALLALVIILFMNIIVRLLYRNISWVYDLSALLSLLVISTALANSAWKKGMVTVTLIIDKLPAQARRILNIVYFVISAIVFGCTFYWMCEVTVRYINEKAVSPTTRIPYWPFSVALDAGFLMVAVVYLVKAIHLVLNNEEVKNEEQQMLEEIEEMKKAELEEEKE